VKLASIFIGAFLGFSYFTVYHIILESRRASRFATHVILCWVDVLAGLFYALLCYLRIIGVLGSSVGLYFAVVTAWIIQVHCLLQIIVSRICVLVLPSTRRRLKLSVAILWTLIGISVYCIWIPAQMHTSQRFETINLYWDHIEKIMYLVTDAALNYYFMYTVKTRLVQFGLTKYDKLVRFNRNIVIVSLSMDCLLIGMMSYPNRFMYTQANAMAFVVKLNIEIAMFGLIVRVAQSTGLTDDDEIHAPSFMMGIASALSTRREPIGLSYSSGHELEFAREWMHSPRSETGEIRDDSAHSIVA